MQTAVKKWGNSLAVRLPKSVIEDMHFKEGTEVTIRFQGGGIFLHPARPKYSLDELLMTTTPENSHKETDWGEPVGKEDW